MGEGFGEEEDFGGKYEASVRFVSLTSLSGIDIEMKKSQTPRVLEKDGNLILITGT